MLQLASKMSVSQLLPFLPGRTKKEVFAGLVDHLEESHPFLQGKHLLQLLWERETLESTAWGGAVAVPHAKMDMDVDLVACVGRSIRGIDCQASDGKRTHLFFVLLASQRVPRVHLEALAWVCKLCQNPNFVTDLRNAVDAKSMLHVLREAESRLRSKDDA